MHIIVMPMHDPDGSMLSHLKTIKTSLNETFTQAFVSVTPITRETQATAVASILDADPFFRVIDLPANLAVGAQFQALYNFTADTCRPDQILHLCFIDRIAFILQTAYRAQFMADVQSVEPAGTPILFQRSEAAWQTHPQNYCDLEQMVTRVGDLLFGQSLDFAWCHLAICTGRLQQILPQITNPNLSMVAEMVLHLRHEIHTKSVDWLAWEDPFIEKRDPLQLKAAREQSRAETDKRLRYVLPMLTLLHQAAQQTS